MFVSIAYLGNTVLFKQCLATYTRLTQAISIASRDIKRASMHIDSSMNGITDCGGFGVERI
jgi:hypothetical protein